MGVSDLVLSLFMYLLISYCCLMILYYRKIKVWDLAAALDPRTPTGSLCLRTLVEHTGRVFRLQFDDFQIVSSSHDDTILIWDFLSPESPSPKVSSPSVEGQAPSFPSASSQAVSSSGNNNVSSSVPTSASSSSSSGGVGAAASSLVGSFPALVIQDEESSSRRPK